MNSERNTPSSLLVYEWLFLFLEKKKRKEKKDTFKFDYKNHMIFKSTRENWGLTGDHMPEVAPSPKPKKARNGWKWDQNPTSC